MYKLHSTLILNSVVALIAATTHQSNCNRKSRKSSLIILKAPKHFNIGKRKIYRLCNNDWNITWLNTPIKSTELLTKLHPNVNFYKLIPHNVSQSIIRISVKVEIKILW